MDWRWVLLKVRGKKWVLLYYAGCCSEMGIGGVILELCGGDLDSVGRELGSLSMCVSVCLCGICVCFVDVCGCCCECGDWEGCSSAVWKISDCWVNWIGCLNVCPPVQFCGMSLLVVCE